MYVFYVFFYVYKYVCMNTCKLCMYMCVYMYVCVCQYFLCYYMKTIKYQLYTIRNWNLPYIKPQYSKCSLVQGTTIL